MHGKLEAQLSELPLQLLRGMLLLARLYNVGGPSPVVIINRDRWALAATRPTAAAVMHKYARCQLTNKWGWQEAWDL